MEHASEGLIESAIRVAATLPGTTLQALAQAIAACPVQHWSLLRQRVSQVLPQPHVRGLMLEMIALWQQEAPNRSPADVALILQTAAAAIQHQRESHTMELTWTGPLVTGASMRRTDQALLQIIDTAHHTLLIVSFAVYKIAAITAALVKAANRGVTIRMCVEAPEPSGQKMAYDTIKAIGPAVAQRATIYVWPNDRRPRDAADNSGVLHVKCAVADSQWLFISSANLTDHAMNLNMELGALIHSERHASTVVTQFEALIAARILQPVAGYP